MFPTYAETMTTPRVVAQFNSSYIPSYAPLRTSQQNFPWKRLPSELRAKIAGLAQVNPHQLSLVSRQDRDFCATNQCYAYEMGLPRPSEGAVSNRQLLPDPNKQLKAYYSNLWDDLLQFPDAEKFLQEQKIIRRKGILSPKEVKLVKQFIADRQYQLDFCLVLMIRTIDHSFPHFSIHPHFSKFIKVLEGNGNVTQKASAMRQLIASTPSNSWADLKIHSFSHTRPMLPLLSREMIDILKLLGVELLDLSFNSLHILPRNISELQKLRFLILAYNQLMALPDSIGDLSSLEHLDISGNLQMKALPVAIRRLARLEVLRIDYINFDTFPDVLNLDNEAMPCLRKICGNGFRDIGFVLTTIRLPKGIQERLRFNSFEFWNNGRRVRRIPCTNLIMEKDLLVILAGYVNLLILGAFFVLCNMRAS